jgi:hypothetical protein
MNVWPVLRGATLADEPAAGPELGRRAERLKSSPATAAQPPASGAATC